MKKEIRAMTYWIEQLHIIAGHEAISRYFHTYCEIAAEHAELFSIQINLQAGMFLAMTPHGWRLPRRNVIARSFRERHCEARSNLPKLRGNLIGTSLKEIASSPYDLLWWKFIRLLAMTSG